MARSHETNRLEAFSDAVFAFALTLLVVSLEVPKTSDDLMELVRGFFPFALMFAMICWIWYQHQQFFSHYDVTGPWVVALNCLLLFVVLFYVYPLKYMTVHLIGPIAGMTDPTTGARFTGGLANGDIVMLLYSSGVVLIFGLFLALHQHVWRHRKTLALGPEASQELKADMRGHAISAGLGLVSIALVFIARRTATNNLVIAAGVIYGLMGPLHAWNGYANGKALAALRKKATTVAKR